MSDLEGDGGASDLRFHAVPFFKALFFMFGGSAVCMCASPAECDTMPQSLSGILRILLLICNTNRSCTCVWLPNKPHTRVYTHMHASGSLHGTRPHLLTLQRYIADVQMCVFMGSTLSALSVYTSHRRDGMLCPSVCSVCMTTI